MLAAYKKGFWRWGRITTSITIAHPLLTGFSNIFWSWGRVSLPAVTFLSSAINTPSALYVANPYREGINNCYIHPILEV